MRVAGARRILVLLVIGASVLIGGCNYTVVPQTQGAGMRFTVVPRDPANNPFGLTDPRTEDGRRFQQREDLRSSILEEGRRNGTPVDTFDPTLERYVSEAVP